MNSANMPSMHPELKGDELLRILQRILPLDVHQGFTSCRSWIPILRMAMRSLSLKPTGSQSMKHLREKFGTADDYLEVFDEKTIDT